MNPVRFSGTNPYYAQAKKDFNPGGFLNTMGISEYTLSQGLNQLTQGVEQDFEALGKRLAAIESRLNIKA